MSEETIVTPTYITLGEAAKRTGLSKATVSRMIKNGKISAKEKGEDGAFRIDPAEIIRFMDAARVTRATHATAVASMREDTNVTSSNADESTSETGYETALREAKERNELELRAKLAEERLNDLKAQIDDIRSERDQWRETAQRALLTHQPLQPTPQPERRGLFGWLGRKVG